MSHNPAPTAAAPWWSKGALMLVAILVMAYNLRPVATEIGPVMSNLQADLGLSGITAGLLTSLPTICFAIFGFAAPWLATRIGMHRLILVAMLALLVGSVARTFTSNQYVFLALSVLALAGMAVGNVLAPSVIRRHFPHQIGLVTALYSLLLSIGVTVASAFTVPMTIALGGWRQAYLASAVTALLAVIPWLFAIGFDKANPQTASAKPASPITLTSVARTPLGWAIAIFFGMQSAQAYSLFGWMPLIYTDAGMSQTDAGWMLGITTGVGVPLAFLWPAYMQRNPRPITLQVIIGLCGLAAYTGLLVAPMTMPWLWATLAAIGTSSFPLILGLFAMKGRTGAGTVALSGFGQGAGYAIALFGPFLVGVLYEATGGWTAPLLLMLAMSLAMSTAGFITVSCGTIEDELGLAPAKH
ncbi:MFS transporter [Propionibacteriaceae bacterium G1746]|uniref:MFS transporter n=1 Tax=Aestuariimicrobium sp. G57 TaxID=3418485 RepID=UPI003C217197